MTKQYLDDALNYFDDFLSYKFPYLELPSISIAVAHENNIIYSRAIGLADKEDNKLATTDTLYRVASNSKMFTSTAIMQLQESGKLRLDDAVAKYVSWINDHSDRRWKTVTIRQLLSHSAGVSRDSPQSGYWSLQYEFPDEETLKDVILNDALVFEPNTKMKYSNYGFGLLGIVIKNASGIDYGDYIKQHITDPLALNHTSSNYDVSIKDKIATGYTDKTVKGRRIPIDTINTKALSPAAGFVSTPCDMALFISSIFDGNTLVSTESSREQRRIHSKAMYSRGAKQYYGLGFELGVIDDEEVVCHGGGFPGQLTETVYLPKSKLGISVMINTRGYPPAHFVRSLIATIHWFEDNYVEKPAHDLTKFTTRYAHLWGETDIIGYGNSLVSFSPQLPLDFDTAQRLERIDNTTLKVTHASSYAGPGETIKYVFNGDGSLDHIDDQGTKLYSVEVHDKEWAVLEMIALPDTKR